MPLINKNTVADNLAKAKEFAGDRIYDIKHSTVGYRLHDRRWSIQESIENDMKGWCDSDVVNLGSRLVEHYAELLDYLSSQAYDDVDMDWFNHLRPIADNFIGYNYIVEELGMLGRFEAIGGTSSNRYNSKIVNETAEAIKARFMEDWKWVGENILTCKFVMPLYHGSTKDTRSFKVQSYYKSVADKIKGGGQRLATAVRRHSSKNSFSKEDISNMPFGELGRTANLLRAMASSTIGYPYQYHGSDSELKKTDDWEERQALAASIMGNPEVAKTNINKKVEGGNIRPVKNQEEPDYAAWIEDISYVADVISSWGDWIKPNGIKENLLLSGASKEQVEELDGKMHEEFMRCWMWIGKNIEGLWI